MAELSKEMGEVLKECGLGKDAVWKHPKRGKWIVYHWACEVAAAKKGIVFDAPTIVCADPANKLATIVVTGRMDKRVEWAFGEAAPYNTNQAYPFAMAEKRAKDRVILKLIGLHGMAYSEEEADEFRPSGNGRDITYAAGAEKAEQPRLDLYSFWGEVEDEFSNPSDFLTALASKLYDTGAYWPPNEHVVKWIGETFKDDAGLRTHARQVYKLGLDAWRNSPDNPDNKAAEAEKPNGG